MSTPDPELRQFLEAVRKLVAGHAGPFDTGTDKLRAALDGADVTDLAIETHGMETALLWLSEVVKEVARENPSLGFVLAARYTAQRAVAAVDGGREVTTAFLDPLPGVSTVDESPSVTVPFFFEPNSVVVLDAATTSAALARQGTFDDSGEASARSGLAGSSLHIVRISGSTTPIDNAVAIGLLRDWHVLTGSVSVGIAESALRAAESYAGERRQFGAKLASFAGLRAILAEMHVRLSTARAVLEQQLGGEPTAPGESAMAAAVAGRAAVDITLDAVQVHGGYGYIDEYPVARLARDAISIRARSGSRRAAVARIADQRLGASV